MYDFKFKKISRKIAIIGTARAGKTVFLTSLINHLLEHNRQDFVIGERVPVQISNFRPVSVPAKVGHKFNYGACRDALVHQGEWPEKTRDTSHFICNFERSDWKFSRNELHFFDLPGERFADAAIARFSDFKEWSAYMLDYILADSHYCNLAGDYLELQKIGAKNNVSPDKILSLYRMTLANFVVNFKPMISPSTFILDQQGESPNGTTHEDFFRDAKNRICGLPVQKKRKREFAPASEALLKHNPAIHRLFASSFSAYRNQVALPLFKNLKSSRRLIILIDIPTLLNGGVAMYNDTREIIDNIFAALAPNSWLEELFKGHNIDRIAFVATKNDAVYPPDLEEGHLKNLLLQMTEKFSFSVPKVKCEWFTCSAIVSAKKAGTDEYMMRGTLLSSTDISDMKTYQVSKLPERWPNNWNPGEFLFPNVKPKVSANKSLAPEQHNLNKIFTFITED